MNERCKFFDECSAPMCPMCEGLENMVWFADEEICKLRDVPDWIKQQRKISKLGVTAEAGCFTLHMLEQRCVTTNKIKGIDPETVGTERKAAEKKWLCMHPPVRKKAKEHKDKLITHLRFLKENRTINDV